MSLSPFCLFQDKFKDRNCVSIILKEMTSLKILTTFEKNLTAFEKMLTVFKKILTNQNVRIFVCPQFFFIFQCNTLGLLLLSNLWCYLNGMTAREDNFSSSLLVTILIAVAIFFNVSLEIVTIGIHRFFKSIPVQDLLWLDTIERTVR